MSTLVTFKSYQLQEVEHGLTVHHPVLGWPVWIPVIGIRLWFKVSDPPRFWDALAPAYERFSEAFEDQLTWQKGLTTKARARLNTKRAIPSLPRRETTEWDIDLCGPGEEKLQAFRCSFRTAAIQESGGLIRGHVYLAVPVDRFISQPALVDALVQDLSLIPGLEFGFAGLCGAGTPDYQSSWRDPEFFILLNYMGLDPSEDAGSEPPESPYEGYGHSAQWINLLGTAAVERLGGPELLAQRASALGLTTSRIGKTMWVRAGEKPDPGYRRKPSLYESVDRLLKPNMTGGYFIGHHFRAFGLDVFGCEPHASVSDLWLRRFEPESAWTATPRTFDAVLIGATRSGGPDITGAPSDTDRPI